MEKEIKRRNSNMLSTADTIKNCWNKVIIMPVPVVVAGGGTRNDVLLYLTSCAPCWLLGEECDVLT